ncbi:MAG: glycosyltransferase family 2 protein [Sedimentisphaerales bacterium]|nr:glycosyltransferase family 2 protein [Sedimentisphaerales bacterium]
MNQLDVSIIIPNYNTRDILRDCLASLYKYPMTVSSEIIVVDNASNDGSAEMVKKEFGQIILIENKVNSGYAGACNLGIKKSKGRYLLILNSDTLALEGTIDKIIRFADENPKAAIIGCRALNPDMTLQPTCFMYPSILNMLLASTYFYKLFPNNKFFGRQAMSWWDRDDTREVDVVTGCCMLVRKEAIDNVGMMDESFFMYAEETDWCYRFKKAGWKVMYTPAAEIIHIGGRSTRHIRGDMLVREKLSVLEFIRKHHGWLYHKVVCFFVILFFVLRLPIWFIASLLTSREEAKVKLKAYLKGIKQVFVAAGKLPQTEN